MEAARPKYTDLIYSQIPLIGRYRRDVLDHFYSRGLSYKQIDAALEWLVRRGMLRACGNIAGLMYVPPNRKIVYGNIRPITGVEILLDMHTQPLTIDEARRTR